MVPCLIGGYGNKTGKIRPTAEKVSFFRVHVLLSTKEELTAESEEEGGFLRSAERTELGRFKKMMDIAASISCQANLLCIVLT